MATIRKDGDTQPDYEHENPDYFTIKMHHEGKVSYLDWVSNDFVSWVVFDLFAKSLGYSPPYDFEYWPPGLKNKPHAILDDINIWEIVLELGAKKQFEMEVYLILAEKDDLIENVEACEGDESHEEEIVADYDSPNQPLSEPEKDTTAHVAEEFEYNQEEFDQEDERDREMRNNQDMSQWWGNHLDFSCLGRDAKKEKEEEDGFSDDGSDLESVYSDDDDRPHSQARDFNPTSNFQNFKFILGMKFGSVNLLRNTIREYFIQHDRAVKFISNDTRRVRVKCKGKGCKWLLYASCIGPGATSFEVRTLNDIHNCGIVLNNKMISSTWLAKHFLDQFRQNPNMHYTNFRELAQNSKYALVSSWCFYRARKKAREALEGSVAEQYAILEDYCKQILITNPGSTAKINCNTIGDKMIFKRVYICFKACKDGFKHGCRKLICVDGCFLKGYCKGLLLAAVGIDPNNCMFPIAYAICEKENTETWSWFLELMKQDLDIENPTQYTMMSDRQKGLINAFGTVMEGADVRFCVRHLHSNFKKEHSGLLLKQQLWACAKATTIPEFQRRMKDIKDTEEAAYHWLLRKDPKEWTKSHFSKDVKCDVLLNNLCESFNSAILDARDKPIISLLEKVRYWIMSRFENRKELVAKWIHPVGSKITRLIEKRKEIVKDCLVRRAGGGKFQIDCSDGQSLCVDLIDKSCTCRLFELSGIPCGHALACICESGHDVMDYVDVCYKKETFEKVYEPTVRPIPSPNFWVNIGSNPIQPPSVTNLPGRPKQARRREADEPPPPGATKKRRFGQVHQCRNCGQSGHTKKTCSNPTVSKPIVQKKRGRPPSSNPTKETLKRKQRLARQREKAVEAST